MKGTSQSPSGALQFMPPIFGLFHSFFETPLYNSSHTRPDMFLFSFTSLSTELSELSPHCTVNLVACVYLIAPFSSLSFFLLILCDHIMYNLQLNWCKPNLKQLKCICVLGLALVHLDSVHCNLVSWDIKLSDRDKTIVRDQSSESLGKNFKFSLIILSHIAFLLISYTSFL